ncbi:catalase isoform X1 [Gadus morhua]|uniref:catalase isoform X1 n=1 Tax=Gadus morhua TaxID=8049 RepID=UPI0011B52C46|nr:catalase-like isoform X1 [Gadus morhua]
MLFTDMIKAHCFLRWPTLLHKEEILTARPSAPQLQEIQYNRDPDTVVTIVNPVEHPRDYVVWSICSFFHANPFCLGMAALIFSIKTDQGIKNLTVEEADRLAASNPDYAIGDLFNAIANGNFPSWSFFSQVMTFEQAVKFRFNPFDLTKVWSHKEYPLIPVGKLVLNRNPTNYFAEVEQLAFDPSNMPPGVEPSPDKMLQGRLFSYPDTHRHRLGANYLQIPVNCPYKTRVSNYQRDGPMCMSDNQGGAPNYFPNSFSAPDCQPCFLESKFKVSPDVTRYESCNDDNYTQAGTFYSEVLSEEERRRLCQNLAGALKGAQVFIQERMVQHLMAIHPDYGKQVQSLLTKHNAEAQKNSNVHVYTRPTAINASAKM